MKGTVILNDGSRVDLPVLTEWKLIHTDGTSSDSFSVGFRWDSSWEKILSRGVRFEAWEEETQRFYGIIDEYEVTWNQGGLTGQLYGRGLAGLLMDNEVPEQEYYWVRLAQILKNYVEPYHIPAVRYAENYWLSAYAVDYGTDCWSALSGFCLWAAGVQPRFLPNGTLVISSEEGAERSLNQDGVETIQWRQTRYGVYSRVMAQYVGTYYVQQVDSGSFQKLGGCATHRMTVPRRNRCRAGLSSPNQVLMNSQKEFRTLEVTMPELFWAEPLDRVTVNLKELGVSGRFLVTETENRVDDGGKQCRLHLREMS